MLIIENEVLRVLALRARKSACKFESLRIKERVNRGKCLLREKKSAIYASYIGQSSGSEVMDRSSIQPISKVTQSAWMLMVHCIAQISPSSSVCVAERHLRVPMSPRMAGRTSSSKRHHSKPHILYLTF